jgi:PAS domain S-box-containing protein
MKSEKKTTQSAERKNAPSSNSFIEDQADLLNYINDAVIAVNSQFQITVWNHAAEVMYGWSAAEVMGKISTEIIRSEMTSEKREEVLGQLRELGSYRSELIQYRKDGQPIYVETNTISLYDDHKQVIGILSVNRDISERKRAEEALQKSQERFSKAFLSSPAGLVISNLENGKLIEANEAYLYMTEYKREEVIGRTTTELNLTSTAERNRLIERLREKGELRNFEMQLQTKSGKLVEMLFSSLQIELDGVPHLLSTTIDITERKRAEEEIRKLNIELEQHVAERSAALLEANTLLQVLLEHMPDHIYFKDSQSRFIRNSMSQAKALGLNNPSQAIGKSDFDFFPHAQLSYEKEQEIIRSGTPLIDQEEKVVWPDGKETWVSTTKMPFVDQSGQVVGTFGISRDITERKQAEAAFQKAKMELEAANKELEAFSYSVSHDLRAPLRTIDGFSQALLEDYGNQLPEEAQGHLTRVRSAAQRMAELIDDLLNLSKVTRAEMKFVPVDLSKVVQEIATGLQQTHRERSVNFIITRNLKAQGDPSLLKAVLENLLNNAWKFTSKQEQAEIEVGSRNENGEIIYFVRDNGAGFDMTYANKLFGAFQRLHAMTEFPGTGIGLATVQRIIHRHGGRVWAEAEVDKGATFFFTLPVLEREKQKAVTQEKDSLATRVKEII